MNTTPSKPIYVDGRLRVEDDQEVRPSPSSRVPKGEILPLTPENNSLCDDV
jgi:hypothetical protein